MQKGLLTKTIFLTLALNGISLTANAKIGDCPSITQGNIEYLSHDTYIEAVNAKNQQIIWHTPLSSGIGNIIMNILSGLIGRESDASMTIACIEKVEGNKITASFGNKTYYLDKNTGKLLEN